MHTSIYTLHGNDDVTHLLRVVHPSIGEEEYACIHPSTHYMVMMMLPTYLEWYIHPSILLMMMDS